MQNAFVESFSGRLRDEFLNEALFTSLMQGRLSPEGRRRDICGSVGQASAVYYANLLLQSLMLLSSAPWRDTSTVKHAGRQTLSETGQERGQRRTRCAVRHIRINLISLARCVVQSSSKNLFLWWSDLVAVAPFRTVSF